VRLGQHALDNAPLAKKNKDINADSEQKKRVIAKYEKH
jgi:hypothetical protein